MKPILTLQDWLANFGRHPNLKLLWFDVKVGDQKIDLMTERLIGLIDNYTSPGKLKATLKVSKLKSSVRQVAKSFGITSKIPYFCPLPVLLLVKVCYKKIELKAITTSGSEMKFLDCPHPTALPKGG